MSQAYGFGMQELKVNSYLGQPLKANVPINVSAGERVNSNCFQVVNTRGSNDLPIINNANARLVQSGGQYSLSLSSSSGIVEPISEITVATNCASLPRMERTFMVMLDPETQVSAARQNNVAPRSEANLLGNASNTASTVTYRQPAYRQPAYTRPRFVAPTNPIAQGTTHTVTFGESLTEIAARVSGRENGSMWRMAAAIHASNPNAFYNGEPNHLEVGASINIPTISNGFNFTETQAQQTLTNPAYRSTTSEFVVDNLAVDTSATTEISTLSSLDVVADSNTTSSNTDTNTTNAQALNANPLVAVTEALPTLTLSSSLSSVSMQRVQARAQGQIVKAFIPDNSDLFSTPNEDKGIVKEAVLTANREADTQLATSTATTETGNAIPAPISNMETSATKITKTFTYLEY